MKKYNIIWIFHQCLAVLRSYSYMLSISLTLCACVCFSLRHVRLCNSMDCSLPSSAVNETFPARILEREMGTHCCIDTKICKILYIFIHLIRHTLCISKVQLTPPVKNLNMTLQLALCIHGSAPVDSTNHRSSSTVLHSHWKPSPYQWAS